jgi:DNA-binding winged helix-turn-helix (wHTH) protein
MPSPQWCFGGFRLDPDNACLWRGAQTIALTPKAFDVLHYLVTHPDRLVSKDTLLEYHLKNSGLKAPALTGCHDKGKWA